MFSPSELVQCKLTWCIAEAVQSHAYQVCLMSSRLQTAPLNVIHVAPSCFDPYGGATNLNIGAQEYSCDPVFDMLHADLLGSPSFNDLLFTVYFEGQA